MEKYKINNIKANYPFINHEEEAFYQRQSHIKSLQQNSGDLFNKFLKDDAAKAKKIWKLLRKQVGPAWFQELSELQIVAANKLFQAVSDATTECQYQRCRNLLREIGLNPLPKKSELLAAIRFCRNNDLALLWFLFDSVYNSYADTKSKQSFSLNQRLLLSCICHLDMMMTLRELDRILPKLKVKVEKNFVARKCKAIKFDSPYDEPVPKPKLQPKRVFPPPQPPHPKFEIYKQYKNPSFVIENEATRWFAQEGLLSESSNIVKGLICDQITEAVDGKIDPERVGLCEKHRVESSKFNQMMGKFIDDSKSGDCGAAEKEIVCRMQNEFAKTEKEFREVSDQNQTEAMMKTLLHQTVDNAAHFKFIHRCEECEKCLKSDKFNTKFMKNNKQITTNEETPSNDANQIKFFHRPSTTSPLQFDYEKIFATNSINDCGVVRNSINLALELDKHLTEDNAITVCLRDLWQSELKVWNEKHQTEIEEKRNLTSTDCDKIGKNKQNVLCLLRKAIAMMRKNPKFVLASLPDVHRLPILKEWILQRFGFRRDANEIEKRWKASEVQRYQLAISGFMPNIKIPNFKVIGIKKVNISYDEASKTVKKRDEWLKNYHKALASGTIKSVRLYWSTMEPFTCDTEKMRQMFYAYMPAHEKEFD